MEENISKRNKIFQIFTFFTLALAVVSTITYMIYTILTSTSVINQIVSIISTIILAIFSIIYVMLGMNIHNNKTRIFIIIGSLLLTFYTIFQVIMGITTPKDYVIDFTNKDIKEVVNWANKRNILIEQEFKNSETIEKYKIISQSIKEGTPTKNLKNIKVVISDGIDENVKTEVTNMVGWDLDKVIKFIDENHLTNVKILFEFSNTIEKDKIISQDVIREIKRNEPVTLISSLGKENELKSVTMDNLVGLDTFHAIIYLKRNNLKYSIEYNYSDTKEEGTVLKQSIKKWEVISPKDKTEIIITVAKKDKITVPDLTKFSLTEINNWATNNRLKIEYIEEYDDTIKKDKIISYTPQKNNLIDIDSIIKIIISKGPLRMIKFTTLEEVKEWLDEHDIIYKINYEYSQTIENGKLISISHKENQIIKNNDTINITISQGGNTIIPKLEGMTIEEAKTACKKANIKCLIGNNHLPEQNTIIKQSMRSGSNVPINTTVTLTVGD